MPSRLVTALGVLAPLLAVFAASVPAESAPAPTAMAYCTIADVQDTYDARTLAQRTGDATGQTINTERLTDAVDDAAAMMEPHVRERYADHEFGVTEPYLNAINCELAYVMLARRKPGGMSDADRADLKRIQGQLRDIASGAVALDVGEPDETGDTLYPADLWRSSPRLFGRHRATTGPPSR